MIGGAGIGRGGISGGFGIGGPGLSLLVPSFELLFADLGGGVVDIRPTSVGPAGTFTRAGNTATTIDKNGLIISASANVPRSYYDPTSLQMLGYLPEGARTNLLLRSEEFDNASWSKTDTTVTANSIASPDGTTSADLLTEGTAGTAVTTQSVTATADATYAVTRFLKRGNHDWVELHFNNGANIVRGWFNLNTGAVGATAVGGTGSATAIRIKAYPSGWYRCELVGSVGSATTAILSGSFSASANNSTTRVNNATRYEWGAGFENNVSFASSYIPTTNATVTRNADVLTYPLTGWFNAAEGTIFAAAQAVNEAQASAFARVVSFNDTTSNEEIYLSRNTTAGRFFVVDGGVAQANPTLGTWNNGASAKLVGAYKVNDFAATMDGAAVQTDALGTIPTVTILNIGGSAGGSAPLFSPIPSIAYYPTRLPNTVLPYQSKTS